ncbi:hypothetical protein [Variovorax sp. Root411]|uniref:hypothetical protein n=1 Tax=Variovorax sp. Root411 TaxID=1736530 RepID=UPI0006F9193D|nr:hypothetical protein [Variovorax sp. Root411]KQW54256.1 hypothetical protein ASC92_19635 [Variovorax sp. Root411]
METKQEQSRGTLARRLMAGLLVLIAVGVVVVLVGDGLIKPADGPGNVPASGAVIPLQQNGSPPTSK